MCRCSGGVKEYTHEENTHARTRTHSQLERHNMHTHAQIPHTHTCKQNTQTSAHTRTGSRWNTCTSVHTHAQPPHTQTCKQNTHASIRTHVETRTHAQTQTLLAWAHTVMGHTPSAGGAHTPTHTHSHAHTTNAHLQLTKSAREPRSCAASSLWQPRSRRAAPPTTVRRYIRVAPSHMSRPFPRRSLAAAPA